MNTYLTIAAVAVCGLISGALGQLDPVQYTEVGQTGGVTTTVESEPDFPGGPTTLENDEDEAGVTGPGASLETFFRSGQNLRSQGDAFGRVDGYVDERVIYADAEFRAEANLNQGDSASAGGTYSVTATFTALEAVPAVVSGAFELIPDGGDALASNGIISTASYTVFGFGPGVPGGFFSIGENVGAGFGVDEVSFFENFQLSPGATYTINAQLSVGASADTNANVVSARASGTLRLRVTFGDRDADGLLDSWEEAGGIDVDGDGTPDVPLPGADPDRKDIFVEVDVSRDTSVSQQALSNVAAVFETAPAEAVANADGSAGITLHTIIDETLPFVASYPSNPTSTAAGIADNFRGTAQERSSPQRDALVAAGAAAYRDCIFGGNQSDEAEGWAEIGGDTFIVTLDGQTGNRSVDNQASTFMHELGHTLGLRHGGVDDINSKPNYFSVMNYAHAGPGPYYILDFSRFRFDTLDEGNLDETAGLGEFPTEFDNILLYYNTTGTVDASNPPLLDQDVAKAPKDWNGDFDFNDVGIQVDLNSVADPSESPSEVLVGAEDWSRLRIPLRGGNGNYGFLSDGGFETGGGETTEIYGADKPSAYYTRVNDLLGPCRVDLDENGRADVFDLLTFLALYAEADPLADWDDSGVIDASDIEAFAIELAAGC